MINIAICEDELKERNLLKSYIEAYMQKKYLDYCIDEYESAENMLEAYETKTYNLIFLDVYMRTLTGIQLAKHIREKDQQVMIVFVTSAMECALEGYKIHAYDYLIKPIIQIDFNHTMADITKHLRVEDHSYYLFPTTAGEIKLDLNKVRYIESNVRKTTIHLEDAFYTCHYSINMMEEKLSDYHFVRTHRSFIVNLRHIKQVANGQVVLEDGETVFLSKYKQKEIKQSFNQYIGGLNHD